MPPMKEIVLSLLLCCLSFPAQTGTVITGRVKDGQGNPIASVMVKLLQADTLIAYTLTSEDGTYTISYDGEMSGLTLTFEHLSYQKFSKTLSNPSQTLDVVLSAKSIALKEVVVRAQAITLQGDTLSYLLSAFTGQGDVMLKDAMRKIPGIDIAPSGQIKYMGKDISHFYIEGMDLLGGKYNIATNNIPAAYVSTVQVLNNHQDVKMDKDIFSDKTAINVKLNPKAKLRPVGTYRATTGYGEEWLYQLSGAGMLFKPYLQSILTAKLGNIREFEQEEQQDLPANESHPTAAHRILGDLGTSHPPLERDRYICPDDRSLSLNILHKSREDATLKTNIGYGYSRTTYDFSTLRQYYQSAASDVIMEQVQEPLSRTHAPAVGVEYLFNGETRYLSNRFSASASFRDAGLPTRTQDSHLAQAQDLKEYDLRNAFSLRWKRGKVRWNLASVIQYTATPTGCLSVSGNRTSDFRQTVHDRRFFTRETVSASYDFSHSRLYFPLTFQVSADRIHTALTLNTLAESNRVNGRNAQFVAAPQYEYTHPLRRFVFRGGLSIRGAYTDVKNTGSSPARDRQFRFSLDPNLYFHYKINAQSALTARFSYRQQTGDALDMLTAPVQTDYLSRSIHSGTLSETGSLTADLHYDFKIPLKMWFLNADVHYNRTEHSLTSGQEVSADLITLTQIRLPNHADRWSASAQVTKQIASLRTKLSLQVAYTWSRNVTSQDGAVIPYYGQNIGLSPRLNARPWDFIELDYQGDFSRIHSHYLDSRRSYASQSHRVKLSLFPLPQWETTLSSDVTRQEISKGIYKTLALFDAGVQYSFHAFRIGIRVNNLLNRRLYAYTVFSGLDKFTYQYRLRGREYLVSLTFIR